jgi:putative SOS response-associated peptidase YedK
MCNLYSLTKSQDAIRALFRVDADGLGNLPVMPGIFPDQMAPVLRRGAAGRELVMQRWGFPAPPGVTGGRPVTNIRNTASNYWRAWMAPRYRCLVPATSFCEYAGAKPALPHWFALAPDRPLFAFAGLWRPWTGTRGKIEGEHALFAFLTTEPNEVVAPIHPKAMPVMLTSEQDFDIWLNAPAEAALKLQKPLPDERLFIVATGAKQDPPPNTLF